MKICLLDQVMVDPKKVNHVVPLLTPSRLAPTGRDDEEKHDKPRVSVAPGVAKGSAPGISTT